MFRNYYLAQSKRYSRPERDWLKHVEPDSFIDTHMMMWLGRNHPEVLAYLPGMMIWLDAFEKMTAGRQGGESEGDMIAKLFVRVRHELRQAAATLIKT